MQTLDTAALIALLALPAVVLLHLWRPRPQRRRVAGVFLWNAVARATQAQRESSRLSATVALARDLAAVAMLVVLAAGGRGHTLVRMASCLVIAALVAASWGWPLLDRTWNVRRLLRLALAATLLSLAAGPSVKGPERGSTLVLVIDRSRSMPAGADLAKRAVMEQGPAERLAVIGFGSAPVVERFPDATRPAETGLKQIDPERSNLHAAVRTALDLISADQRGRVLVESDGLADDKLSDELAGQIQARGIPIDFHHRSRMAKDDVVLAEVAAASQAEPGETIQFHLHVHFAGTEAKRGMLRVLRDGVLLGGEVEIATGSTQLAWTEHATPAGTSHYRFELHVPDDPTPENNVWDALVTAAGISDVLVVNSDGRDTFLVDLLRRAGLGVSVGRPNSSELSPERLGDFSACVLQNVPAAEFRQTRLETLARYVEQQGGGLVICGGPRSFAAGGYRVTPLEPLFPVTLSPLDARSRPATAVVVLVASSSWDIPPQQVGLPGSPDRSQLQNALAELARSLGPGDAVAIVTSELPNQLILPLTSSAQRRDIVAAIEQLGPYGEHGYRPGTLELALSLLNTAPQPVKQLLMLGELDQTAGAWAADVANISGRALGGMSVTIVTGATAPNAARDWLSTRLPNLRVRTAGNSDQLGPLMLDEVGFRVGGGYVDREASVRSAGATPAAGDDTPVRVRGFHEALVREGAEVTLLAVDDDGVRAAQWPRGLGRVAALLFPIEPALDDSQAAKLDAIVLRHARWAGRLDQPRPALPITVERSHRTAVLKIALADADAVAGQHAASLELTVVAADGSTPSRVEPFRRVGAELLARFALERPGVHFAVIRPSDGRVLRRVPVMLPRSAEFLPSGTAADGRSRLAELARRSGGREWKWGMPLFDAPEQVRRSLMGPLLWLAAALVLVDVADRRHRISERIDGVWSRLRAGRRKTTATAAPPEPAADLFARAKEQSRRRMQR